jgi:glycerophosphoryl diester phosphodiesterase
LVAILAHRGANRVARENTIAAFTAARGLGADGVELDVRRTADGVLVVHHDPTVDTEGGPLDIAHSPAGALPDWVPTLADALRACVGWGMVNVEVKRDRADGVDRGDLESLVKDVLEVIEQYPAATAHSTATHEPALPGAVLVSSFDRAVIDRVHAVAPSVPTGWLYLGDAAAPEWAATAGHRAVHPHHLSIDAALVGAAHERDLLVAAWTVDEPPRARELAALGVDIVITNAPDEVRAAITPPASRH